MDMLINSLGLKDIINNQLLTAIKEANYSTAENLIIIGADVNAIDETSTSCLWHAAQNNQIHLVKLLIKNNVDVKNFKLLNLMRETYISSDIITLLLQNGADISTPDGDIEFSPLMYIIDSIDLLNAQYDNRLEIIDLMIQRGVNVNFCSQSGDTPLHQAAYYGETDIANLLIQHGAGIDITNRSGETPLIIAAQRGQTTTVNLLIQRGADLDITSNSGCTALMAAINHKKQAAYRILWEMTPAQREGFANQDERYRQVVDLFNISLKENANKIFDIVMPAMRIGLNNPLVKHHKIEPALWHKIEVFSQYFPDWYKPCIEKHFELAMQLANKYHRKSDHSAVKLLPLIAPVAPEYFQLFSSLNVNLISSCFNTVTSYAQRIRPYLPSVCKMEIDSIEEPDGRLKREHQDAQHEQGPARKRKKI